jgi:hypothetical protein
MKHYNVLILIAAFVLSLSFLSCNNEEIGSSRDVEPRSIFFDYQVRAEESRNDVTVMLQYRFGGKNGTTLFLEAPSKVELDGQLIPVDSSKMTGAFYEFQQPVENFLGKHSIRFTDREGKKYEEAFEFRTMRLAREIPDSIPRGELILELQGVDPGAIVRVLLSDTSFTGEGINRLESVQDSKIRITAAEMDKLANGPIHLELIQETEEPIKNGTPEGGRLSISYGLRREFLLR